MEADEPSWLKRRALSQTGWTRIGKRHQLFIAGVALILSILLLWWQGPAIWQLLQDEKALEQWIARLGMWGPLALIGFNAMQIVVAPVPGYVVQLASGFLFGPFWGGVWGSIGLMAGSMLAMWLARTFGRPLATRLIGAQRLDRWETVTHSSSFVVWFILILAPTGDLPYFLAGLSRVPYHTVALLTLAIRVPTTFVVAAAGAGVMLLNWWQLTAAVVALSLLLFIFLRYQDQIVEWLDVRIHGRL